MQCPCHGGGDLQRTPEPHCKSSRSKRAAHLGSCSQESFENSHNEDSGVVRLAHPARAPFSRDGAPRDPESTPKGKQGQVHAARKAVRKQTDNDDEAPGVWACRGSAEFRSRVKTPVVNDVEPNLSTRLARSLQHRKHHDCNSGRWLGESRPEDSTPRLPRRLLAKNILIPLLWRRGLTRGAAGFQIRVTGADPDRHWPTLGDVQVVAIRQVSARSLLVVRP
jgi:hypothetical protein